MNANDSAKSLAALQAYYKIVSAEKGWDKEDPKDIMLLLTEEVGELARAVRKHHDLKRAAGYEGVSIQDELADVQLYLVHLANTLDVELSDAVIAKIEKNNRK